jgi:hypothetical protein
MTGFVYEVDPRSPAFAEDKLRGDDRGERMPGNAKLTHHPKLTHDPDFFRPA